MVGRTCHMPMETSSHDTILDMRHSLVPPFTLTPPPPPPLIYPHFTIHSLTTTLSPPIPHPITTFFASQVYPTDGFSYAYASDDDDANVGTDATDDEASSSSGGSGSGGGGTGNHAKGPGKEKIIT